MANPDPLCHRPEDDRIPAVPRVHQLVPPVTLGRSDELEKVRRVHTGVPVEVGLVALAGGLHPPVAAALDEEPGDVSLERSLVNRTHPAITISQDLIIRAS